jgi:hypothetical protein
MVEAIHANPIPIFFDSGLHTKSMLSLNGHPPMKQLFKAKTIDSITGNRQRHVSKVEVYMALVASVFLEIICSIVVSSASVVGWTRTKW